MAIYQEIGNRSDIASGLESLGGVLLNFGKFAESHSVLEKSVAIRKDLADGDGIARLRLWLGRVQLHLGRYEQAHTLAQMSLTFFQEIGYQRGMGFALLLLGQIALAEKKYNEARQSWQEAVVIFREIGPWFFLGQPLAFLGYTACGHGNISQAQQHLSKALRIGFETGTILPLVFSLPAIALLLIDEGETEQAVELYALASCHPHIANSRWFEDVAGRHISAEAATLPPEVVAAAQERGRTCDLWATAAELLAELESL